MNANAFQALDPCQPGGKFCQLGIHQGQRITTAEDNFFKGFVLLDGSQGWSPLVEGMGLLRIRVVTPETVTAMKMTLAGHQQQSTILMLPDHPRHGHPTFLADRISGVSERFAWLFPALIAAGLASLLYWIWTEAQGRGDLRFYAMVQLYPIIALPVICWLFPGARHTSGRYLVWIILWYGAAKILEHFDAEIFGLLGGTISGHTLKHLASAVAAYVIWRMVENVRRG